MSELIPTPLDLATTSISIAIISKGRPAILQETLESFSRQTFKPAQIVVVVPTQADLPKESWGPEVQFMVGFDGGCIQRNKALEAIPLTIDYVGFFDDDFELKTDYLAEAVRFLNRSFSTVGFSGLVLADGRISREEARQQLAVFEHPRRDGDLFKSEGKFHSLYGCNMIIRRSILDYERLDENLPLYSFAEDYDLSVRLERYGKIGKFQRCVGIHLAAAGGRVREVQRGYAYVANPWYFLKKGSTHLSPEMSWIRFWVVSAGKTCWSSLWKIITGDRTQDWSGRLRGSLLAIRDIFAGRCDPKRVQDL